MIHKITIKVLMLAMAVCVGCVSHTTEKTTEKKLAKERIDKASAGIKLHLAQQKYEENCFDEAEKIISECIAADPNSAQAHLLYGKLFLAGDKLADAEKELSLAVNIDGELGEGWYWLGLAAQKSGQGQQSLVYYNKALALSPADVDYILAVAEMYAEQEKFEDAIKLLEERIAAMPREISLKTAAADLMWGLGENERAIKLYKEAMLMKDDDDSIAEALGLCYVFSSRWNEGAEIFNKLAEKYSHLGEAGGQNEQKKSLYLQMAALCSMNCAQYERAINCYNKLSVKEKDNAEIWVKMGQASLGAGSAERALMCGERALALQPGDADATALVGCAQYSVGDFAAAIKTFEKITSDEKNRGLSWLMKARCYERLGLNDQAGQAYKKAFEIEPGSKLGALLAKGKSINDLEITTGY
jgi:tetratricopeptide (TPR) repeat protein